MAPVLIEMPNLMAIEARLQSREAYLHQIQKDELVSSIDCMIVKHTTIDIQFRKESAWDHVP